MNASGRRNFLKKAVFGTTGLAAIPSILAASELSVPSQRSTDPKISLLKEDVILFQGDSITDAGRDKENKDPNNQKALGGGYAFLAAAEILKEHASQELLIYNRGISGNKVFQLAERWQADCLDIKPKVLSILIGVNDYWHKHNGKYDGTIGIYENDYRKLLKQTKEALPDTILVIGEPFAVLGCKAVDQTWFPDFEAYRTVAKKLSEEFHTIFIPYHSIFAEAAKVVKPSYWTADGVHPSIAGAKLMAESWIKYVLEK